MTTGLYTIQERTPGGDWYVANPSGMIIARYPTKAEAVKEMRRMNREVAS